VIWGAHKAEGRIAAKNATKIRAALGQQIDPKKVYEGYQETQPIKTDNLAQDRSRARSWAMLNVNLEMDAVYLALVRLWTEAFIMGQLAAREAIKKAKELQKAGDTDYIDWDNWTPGDEVAAALVKPPGALERLLNAGKARIRGLEKETYNEIGSALGESIALGLSSRQASRLIQDHVQSASRALTIAITETNRVASYAAMETYKEFGLEKHEWLPINPCDVCALNDGAVVNIGSPFPSGVIQPPQHPNCRCALIPVIPDMSETPNENGVVDIAPDMATEPLVGEDGEVFPSEVGDFARVTEEGREDFEMLVDQFGEPSEDLQYAAQRWQGEDYRRIQGSLTGGDPSDELQEIITILDDSMQPLENFEFGSLYRGQTEGLSQLKVGDKFKSKLFQATTTDPVTAAGFSKSSGSVVGGIRTGETATILRINAYDASGLVVPGSAEYEVILARGTTFQVMGISEEIIGGVKMTVIDVYAVTP
jgi:SPP1 gp7 family putative phage head morphogenesis protein